jgi:hypothetical protein
LEDKIDEAKGEVYKLVYQIKGVGIRAGEGDKLVLKKSDEKISQEDKDLLP